MGRPLRLFARLCGPVLCLGLLVPLPGHAQVVLDGERGVFSFNAVLAPIMPGVVQILVEKTATADGDRPRSEAQSRPDLSRGQGDGWQGDGGRGDGGQGVPRLPLPPGLGRAPDQPEPGRVQRGSGSGLVVSAEKGLIMTNHHVVEDATQITVKLNDGRSYAAELVGSDEATDIALIRVTTDDPLTELSLAESDDLRVGDLVIAIGYPFGLDQTATIGIVSGLGRQRGIAELEDFIQTDAAINSGNSGGPLVDTRGRVVGINSAIYSSSGGNIGIGFAVPTHIARAVMIQLEAYGEVRRGRLGVAIQSVTPELASAVSASVTHGALITRVEQQSPAEAAGLRSGDIVIEADGTAVDTAADLRNAVGLAGPDATLSLVVLREGQRIEVAVSLQVPEPSAGSLLLLGASLGPLPSDNPLSGKVEGVLVTAVEPDSPMARQGVREGDVITDVNQKPVTTANGLTDAVDKAGKVAALTVVRGNSQFLVVLERGTSS